MKAVVYKGKTQVELEGVEDPRIEEPRDAIVRITSTAICGSDLHMYSGCTSAEPGLILGHEPMGVVEEVGPGVKSIKKGDRVVMPFNIACGCCYNCVRGFPNACLTMNPQKAGAAYGYAGMGPYAGGQAEYLRVPMADYDCLKLPSEPGDEFEDDCSIDAVGYQATDYEEDQEEIQANIVLNDPISLVNPTGHIGVIGVYVAQNPCAKSPEGQRGAIQIEWGTLWQKGIRVGTWQAPVAMYNRQLRYLIIAGIAKPSLIITQRVPLEAAPDAYNKLYKREPGYTKVVLKPGMK